MPSREPRLWSSDAGASWRRVAGLVDANGIAQTVMVQLTGGVFLTGLALTLGANAIVIGVLAALPLAAKVSQLVLSWWIERAGRWRRWSIASGAIARVALIAVPILVLAPGPAALRLTMLACVVGVSALAGAVFELSFLTWLAELIPEPLRGVFWGKRGRNAGVVGTVASILAAIRLDRSPTTSSSQIGFAIVFGAGAVLGLIGILFLRHLPRPRRRETRTAPLDLVTALRAPIHDKNYRTMLIFSAWWSFASGYMAPFYMVYMLRTLGLSFLAVTLLTTITNSIMALTQTRWGTLGDHFGTKPVLRIGSYLIACTPVLWLISAPSRIWPVVLVEVLSGLGWSAYHVSLSNLALKLAPDESRPSYLGAFGAFSGLAEGAAPLVSGALLTILAPTATPSLGGFRTMMIVQLVLFGIATALPQWIHEPRGRPVGHLIRVLARFQAMDSSRPVSLVFEYGYTHLARVADLIAREFPRDAEPI